MDCKMVKKVFRIVGIKGNGLYDNFGVEVPKLAQQLQLRKGEIEHHSGTEIALFEPKRDESHLEGQYFVGFIVNEAEQSVPAGMDYIETAQSYVTTRGNINHLSNLHNQLLQWADEQGFKRDLEAQIVETYHPIENGEEVEIYLPILS